MQTNNVLCVCVVVVVVCCMYGGLWYVGVCVWYTWCVCCVVCCGECVDIQPHADLHDDSITCLADLGGQSMACEIRQAKFESCFHYFQLFDLGDIIFF